MKKLVIVNRAQVSFDPELWRGRNNFPLSIDLSGLAQTGQQEMNCGALPYMTFKTTHNKDESLPQFMKSPQLILLNDYDFWQFSTHPWYMRVCGKLRKLKKK